MSHDEAATIALNAGFDSHRGGWWFRNRSWLPVPLAVVLIAATHRTPYSFAAVACGVPLVLIGEVIRMYGVRHIGTVSRTRADRTGPLITSGPYALVRNPLYIGNWFIWMGIALASGVLWMIPISWMVLQGEVDQVCAADVTRPFVAGTGAARVFLLPKVGHGFGVKIGRAHV